MATQTRRPAVAKEVLFAALITASAAGKTNAELAAELNMDPNSLQQRRSQLRKEFNEDLPAWQAQNPGAKAPEFPELADGREGQNSKRAPSVMDLLSALKRAEPATEGESAEAPASDAQPQG